MKLLRGRTLTTIGFLVVLGLFSYQAITRTSIDPVLGNAFTIFAATLTGTIGAASVGKTIVNKKNLNKD